MHFLVFRHSCNKRAQIVISQMWYILRGSDYVSGLLAGFEPVTSRILRGN